MDKLYADLNFPASYAEINALQREIKGKPEAKEFKQFLQRNRTYQLYRPRYYKFKRLKTYCTSWMTDFQTDLGDFQSLSRHNKGYRFLLVVIDVLSHKIFGVPIKSKSYKDVIPAFKKVFEKTPRLPYSLYSDRGGEFQGREMLKFFKELNIQKYASQTSEIKAGMAERAIRTIKGRLYKYFSENNTVTWYNVIDKIIDNINNTVCRTTGLKPNSINETNAQQVWDKVYGQHTEERSQPRFKVGEHVRLALKRKGAFEKGYLSNYTDEIFDIVKVHHTNPPTYILRHEDGSILRGKVYEKQLIKTVKDDQTTYRVEKVIRQKRENGKKHYYVKFVGLPNAQWITEDDFV